MTFQQTGQDTQRVKRGRRGRCRLSPSGYNELRRTLSGQGPVKEPHANNTEINKTGIWNRWIKYCEAINEDPETLLKESRAQDFIVFFQWILDHYPRVRKYSTLHQYFRIFKMVYESHTGEWMRDDTVKTVNSYLRAILRKKYDLSRSVSMKPVMSVDDLVRVLHHHWVLSSSTFCDERQRVQEAWLFLIAAYSGHRPHSILDATRSPLYSCPGVNVVHPFKSLSPSTCFSALSA